MKSHIPVVVSMPLECRPARTLSLCPLCVLGGSRGDEIITTPFTFFATIGSIMRVGATVVLADIQPETFNIDPSHVRKLITKKTKAIIPIHLFGQCAEMEYLVENCRRKKYSIN